MVVAGSAPDSCKTGISFEEKELNLASTLPLSASASSPVALLPISGVCRASFKTRPGLAVLRPVAVLRRGQEKGGGKQVEF